MVYPWSRITAISVTGLGIALVIFAVWTLFANQYLSYSQGLITLGSAMMIGGGVLYLLYRLKKIALEISN